jgi:hypothetical protein
MQETPEPSYVEFGRPERKPRRRGPALIAAGTVAGITGLGLTAMAAAHANAPSAANPAGASTPATATATSAPAPVPTSGPGRFGGRKGGMHGGEFGARGALHGEFVVQKADGTYQTVDVQQGAVTAVSTSSITVKSTDGFTKSYAVTATTLVDAQRDGIATVKVGHTVHVEATVSGGNATATAIGDETLAPADQRGFGGGHGRPGDDGPPAPPVPSGSASGSTSGSAYTNGA